MISVRDYANQHNVSYEAIRQQINRNIDVLGEHIIVQNRTKYLDDEGQKILDDIRKDSVVVLIDRQKVEEIESLKKDKEDLQAKVVYLYEQLDKRSNELFAIQDKQIALIEDKQNAVNEVRTELDQVRTAAEQKISEADSRVREAESRAMAAEQRTATLEAELNALKMAAEQKPKGFFSRLFGI